MSRKLPSSFRPILRSLKKRAQSLKGLLRYQRPFSNLDAEIMRIQQSTRTLFPVFSHIHNWLRMKSQAYYAWHLKSYAKTVHYAVLGVHILLIVSLSLSFVLYDLANNRAYAATNVWDFNSSGNYVYDSDKIEITDGTAQLKATGSYTPGTDWIATDNNGNNWTYRKTITIDNTKVTADLTDFPVLISLTDTDLKSTANGGYVGSATGADLVFTSSNGTTKLSHELEKYTAATGEVLAWVKVPSLANASDTTIYLYYGNANASNQQSATSVWDSNYQLTYHMPDGSTFSAADSTSNNRSGTATSVAATTGKIDGGGSFNGSSSKVTRSISGTALTQLTYEFWFQTTTVAAGTGGIANWANNATSSSPFITINRDGSALRFYVDGNYRNSSTALSANTWYHVALTLNTSNLWTFYVNGTSVGTYQDDATKANQSSANTLTLGQEFFGYLSGKMDETRISNVARSADWIQTQYNNTNSPDTFYSVGIHTTRTSYPTDNPTITNTTAHPYLALPGFAAVEATDSAGTIKFQISPDNGTTWYWHNGSAWTTTESGYAEANTAADINTNIGTFTAGSGTRQFKWRAYFNSNGSQQPQLTAVTLGLTNTDSLTTAANYSYDSTKIEFSDGVAQLKNNYDAANEWIAAENGNAWNYRKTITIDNTKVDDDFTDFPVLISFTDNDFKIVANGGGVGKIDGTDIVFTSSDKRTKLSYELEKYNASTGEIIAWVKVPTLANGTDTVLYVYYGNANASDQTNGTAAWDSNYKAVWHLPNGTTLSGTDSTSNNNSGTPTNGTAGAGKIDGARTDGYINAGSGLNTVGDGVISIEAWVYPNFSGSSMEIFCINADRFTAQSICLEYGNSSFKLTALIGGSRVSTSTGTLTVGSWNHVALVRTGTTDNWTLTFYVNGIAAGTSTTSTNPSSSASTRAVIGALYDGGNSILSFSGGIDEVRVSNTGRSANWIKTSYTNQNSPSTFYTIGSQTQPFSFATDNPTLVPNDSISYTDLAGFQQTLASGSSGTIKYQLSPDGGTTWYWHNGSVWTTTESGYAEANTAADINTHLTTFTAGSGTRSLKWRAYFNSDGTTQPKLTSLATYYYAPPAAPTMGAASSITTSSITWNWTDQSTYEGQFILYDAANDNTVTTKSSDTITGSGQTYSHQETGLSPNTQYSRYLKSSDGNTSTASSTASAYTLANTPGTPTTSNFTATTATLIIDPNSNPAQTEFAIGVDNNSDGLVDSDGYLQAPSSGSSSLGASASWQTYSSWGGASGITVSNLTPNTTYRFIVKARNGDNTETAFSSGSAATYTLANLPNAPTVNSTSSTSLTIIISANSNPADTQFVIYNETAGKYVQADGTLGDTAAWQTYASWGGASGITNIGLTENTNYTYKVKARNTNSVETALSTGTSAVTPIAPVAPSSVSIQDKSDTTHTDYYQFSVQWTAVANVALDYYIIERSTDGSNYSQVATTTNRYYDDNSLTEGTTYYYRIKTHTSLPDTSAPSSVVSATAGTQLTFSSISAGTPGQTRATITWSSNLATDSVIEYGTTSNYGSSAGNPSASETDHSVTLSNLSLGTTYHYRVKGRTATGLVAVSNDGTFTTSSDTTGPTISEVTVASKNNSSATITWVTDENADSTIEYGTTNSLGSTASDTTLSSATKRRHTVTLSDLSAGTTYYYRVKSTDIYGNTSTGTEATFTTSAADQSDVTAPTIGSVTTSGLTHNSVTVAWTSSEDGTSNVEFSTDKDTVSNGKGSSQGKVGLRTNHQITVTGLSVGTTYYYRVATTDAAGNTGYSNLSSFTTSAEKTAAAIGSGLGEIKLLSTTAKDNITTQATVTWSTDMLTSSYVKYGLTKSYGATQGIEEQTKTHVVTLTGLQPNTTYHYQVFGEDAAGNLVIGEDKTFTTGTVTTPSISQVKVSGTTLTSATITWSTTKTASTQVLYGTNPNDLGLKTTEVNDPDTNHTVNLTSLNAGTTYYFKVRSQVIENGTKGDELQSALFSLSTITAPEFTGLTIQSVKDTEASIQARLTVPADTRIEYADNPSFANSLQQGGTASADTHTITLVGLKPATQYYIRGRATDSYGNRTTSQVATFKTSSDTFPPVITDLTTETQTIGSGDNVSSQILLKITTNEPVKAVVRYSQGSSLTESAIQIKGPETANTVTVISLNGLRPATTYAYEVIVTDDNQNQTKSQIKSALTPPAAANIVTVIVLELSKAFGPLAKIFTQ